MKRGATLQQHDGKWVGALDKMMVQFAPGEKNLQAVSHVVNLQMNEATYQQMKQMGALVLTDRLEVVPGATLLRILVRDVPSGALGSVSVTLPPVWPGRHP